MERGPMALFGAIVAVGLGPAMWIGAQFGPGVPAQPRPPVLTVDDAHDRAPGAAGAAPDDGTDVDTITGREIRPLSTIASTRPTGHRVDRRQPVPASSSPSSGPSSTPPAPVESSPSPSSAPPSSPPAEPEATAAPTTSAPAGGDADGDTEVRLDLS